MQTLEQLRDTERLRDVALCGHELAENAATHYASEGAHDPTASHYFVLDDLFARLNLDECSRVLDVGCGAGRVLVHFARSGFSGHIDGVELDPTLAERARCATEGISRADVILGNVLDVPLGDYSHFYLFNPFDSWVLERFVEKLESEFDGAYDADSVRRPAVLCHMSDNGENYLFMGRPGWRLVDEGSFQYKDGVRVFEHPQHWSIWTYEKGRS